MKIENIDQAESILAKAGDWAKVWEQAEQDSAVIKTAMDGVKQAREAGTGTTGMFLEIAKKYPEREQWAAAWAAMKFARGKKHVPQTLKDGYSVIRRAMIAGVCGIVTDDAGAPVAVIKGGIQKATSFNALKVALREHGKEAAKQAADDPGIMAITRLREIYIAADGEARTALLEEIRQVFARSKGILMTIAAPLVAPQESDQPTPQAKVEDDGTPIADTILATPTSKATGKGKGKGKAVSA